MKKFYIYLDDMRNCPYKEDEKWVYCICRTYQAAIDAIIFCVEQKIPFVIDLDHDLGEPHNGYDVCKYIIENGIRCLYRIHSMNPVGAQNMRQLLSRYGCIEITA